mmetsp:Transcript_84730/g.159677  ORF Transcript_84730/g.159677 Transcript_84730/m.159677 type:complete len:1370 (-) Transcript_84730:28-4137(-)
MQWPCPLIASIFVVAAVTLCISESTGSCTHGSHANGRNSCDETNDEFSFMQMRFSKSEPDPVINHTLSDVHVINEYRFNEEEAVDTQGLTEDVKHEGFFAGALHWLKDHVLWPKPRGIKVLVVDDAGPSRFEGQGVRLMAMLVDFQLADCLVTVDVLQNSERPLELGWDPEVQHLFQHVRVRSVTKEEAANMQLSEYDGIILGAKLDKLEEGSLFHSMTSKLLKLKEANASLQDKTSVFFDDVPDTRCAYRNVCDKIPALLYDTANISVSFIALTPEDAASLDLYQRRLQGIAMAKRRQTSVWPLRLRTMGKLLGTEQQQMHLVNSNRQKVRKYLTMLGNNNQVNQENVKVLFESGALRRLCDAVKLRNSTLQFLFIGGISHFVRTMLNLTVNTDTFPQPDCVLTWDHVTEDDFSKDVLPQTRAFLNPRFKQVRSGISVKSFEAFVTGVPLVTMRDSFAGLLGIPGCDVPMPADSSPDSLVQFIIENVIDWERYVDLAIHWAEASRTCEAGQLLAYPLAEACPGQSSSEEGISACDAMQTLWSKASRLLDRSQRDEVDMTPSCEFIEYFYRWHSMDNESAFPEINASPQQTLRYIREWKVANNLIRRNMPPNVSIASDADPSPFQFTFVRSPIDHFVSGYSEMEYRLTHESGDPIQWPSQNPIRSHLKPNSFIKMNNTMQRARTFLQELASGSIPSDAVFLHAFSMMGPIRFIRNKVNFIGKLDTLQEGLKYIQQAVNISFPRLDPNRGKHVATDKTSNFPPRLAMQSLRDLDTDVQLALGCALLLPDYVCLEFTNELATTEQCIAAGFAADLDSWKNEIARVRAAMCPQRLQLLQDRPDAAGGNAQRFILASHHKTGTVMMQSMLKCLLGSDPSMKVKVDNHWLEEFGRNTAAAAMVNPPDARVVHMTRDPLAIVVSNYKYNMKSNESWLHTPVDAHILNGMFGTDFQEGETQAEFLKRSPETEGLRFELLRFFTGQMLTMQTARDECEARAGSCLQLCLEQFTSSSNAFNSTSLRMLQFLGLAYEEPLTTCLAREDTNSVAWLGHYHSRHVLNDESVERMLEKVRKLDAELLHGRIARESLKYNCAGHAWETQAQNFSMQQPLIILKSARTGSSWLVEALRNTGSFREVIPEVENKVCPGRPSSQSEFEYCEKAITEMLQHLACKEHRCGAFSLSALKPMSTGCLKPCWQHMTASLQQLNPMVVVLRRHNVVAMAASHLKSTEVKNRNLCETPFHLENCSLQVQMSKISPKPEELLEEARSIATRQAQMDDLREDFLPSGGRSLDIFFEDFMTSDGPHFPSNLSSFLQLPAAAIAQIDTNEMLHQGTKHAEVEEGQPKLTTILANFEVVRSYFEEHAPELVSFLMAA